MDPLLRTGFLKWLTLFLMFRPIWPFYSSGLSSLQKLQPSTANHDQCLSNKYIDPSVCVCVGFLYFYYFCPFSSFSVAMGTYTCTVSLFWVTTFSFLHVEKRRGGGEKYSFLCCHNTHQVTPWLEPGLCAWQCKHPTWRASSLILDPEFWTLYPSVWWGLELAATRGQQMGFIAPFIWL